MDERNFQHILSKQSGGNAVVVVPGGVREMLTSRDGNTIELVLKTRKGFVKQAIKHGQVPIFVSLELFLLENGNILSGTTFQCKPGSCLYFWGK